MHSFSAVPCEYLNWFITLRLYRAKNKNFQKLVLIYFPELQVRICVILNAVQKIKEKSWCTLTYNIMAPAAFQHDASWPKAEIDALNASEPDGEPEPSDDQAEDDPDDDDDQEDPSDSAGSADGGAAAEEASEVCISAVNTNFWHLEGKVFCFCLKVLWCLMNLWFYLKFPVHQCPTAGSSSTSFAGIWSWWSGWGNGTHGAGWNPRPHHHRNTGDLPRPTSPWQSIGDGIFTGAWFRGCRRARAAMQISTLESNPAGWLRWWKWASSAYRPKW